MKGSHGRLRAVRSDDHGGDHDTADLVGELAVLRAEVYHLQRALDSRAPIEQAKGVLMLRYGIDADHAFSMLVQWSNDTNTKLSALAEALTKVVGGGANLADPPLETARQLVEQLRGPGASTTDTVAPIAPP